MKKLRGLNVPFALLFPGLQLLLALFIVTPELMVAVELEHRPHSVTLSGKVVPGNLDLNEIINIDTHLPVRRYPDRLHAMSILNMPGMLAEIVSSLPTTWPESWFPRSLYFEDLWTWRALSWAVYTLPLWWIAGRALDALGVRRNISMPRIRLSEMVVILALGVFTLFIGVGLFVTANTREDDEAINRWVLFPGLMWFSFGLCSFVAWRRQRRTRRALAVAEVWLGHEGIRG